MFIYFAIMEVRTALTAPLPAASGSISRRACRLWVDNALTSSSPSLALLPVVSTNRTVFGRRAV
jgi:hypothetical protein